MELVNLISLIEDLKGLRNEWEAILSESKLVADNYEIEHSFTDTEKRQKKRKLFVDETGDLTNLDDPEEKI